MNFFRNTALALAAATLLTSTAHASGWGTEGINPGGALFNDKTFVIVIFFLNDKTQLIPNDGRHVGR